MSPSAPVAQPLRAGRRAVLVGLFAVYVGVLIWAVMWKFHEPFIGRDDMRGIKLVPFVASGGFGSSAPGELIANLLLFVPLGAYLGILAPPWRVGRVLAVSVAVSIALEVAQYVTAAGSSDVTDVIMNSSGALAGILLIRPVLRHSRSQPSGVLTWACATITAVGLLAVAVHIASFPTLPPGQVIILAPLVMQPVLT